MELKRLGFIGGGNMAFALVKGIVSSGSAAEVTVSDKDEEKLAKFSELGVRTSLHNSEAVRAADAVVLAVKPNIVPLVLDEIKDLLGDKILISIAAGVSLENILAKLGSGAKIVRVMPNTPAQVSCGMAVLSPGNNVSDDEAAAVEAIFRSVGEAVILDEKFMSAATALHGSSPAYVYMMIDAMADSGVKYGLTKKQALLLAAKAVEGSAKMVLETGEHPSVLKDNVCSPAGTTIAAVCELERSGFKSSLQQAIDACVEKADNMVK